METRSGSGLITEPESFLPYFLLTSMSMIVKGFSRAASSVALLLTAVSCAVVQPSTGVVPGSEAWSSAPPLLHPRSSHAVVSTTMGIYVFGGTGAGGRAVKEVERFDGQSWQEETVLTGEGLNAPVAAAIGSRIYIIGGFKTVTNVPTSEVLVYDIVS